MLDSGKVSIIITVHSEKAASLTNCVRSLLQQGYRNWEAIIISQSSCLETQKLIQDLVCLDPKRLSSRSAFTAHASQTLNHAIESSAGEYILPLHHTDELNPNALQELVAALKNDKDCAISYCRIETKNSDVDECSLWIPGQCRIEEFIIENVLPHSSMWKRELWDSGVRYRECIYEDWDLWLQILSLGKKAKYVEQFLIKHLKHPHQLLFERNAMYYMGLAQNILFNPNLYPEPMRLWANNALANAPQCLSRAAVAFLPNPNNPEFVEFSGSFFNLAKKFLEHKHLVVTIGSNLNNPGFHPGLIMFNLEKNDHKAEIRDYLKKVGKEVIVITDRSDAFLQDLKEIKNISSIISVAPGSLPNADLLLNSTGSSFSLKTPGLELFQEQVSAGVNDLAQTIAEKSALVSRSKNDGESAFKNKLAKLLLKSKSLNSYNKVPITSENKLSVVIPSRNVDVDRLRRCLHSIRLSESSKDTDIVISDFGSSPDFLKALRTLSAEHECQLVEAKTREQWSRARALNIGIRACKTPWVLFTDADMIFDRELLDMWRSYHEELGTRVMYLCQCKKLPPIADLPARLDSSTYTKISAQGRVYGRYGQGGFQILEREWLEKVRGFNEVYQIWGAEDNDLSFRAKKDGIKTAWMAAGKLLHQWHIKSVSTDWRDKNRAALHELYENPRLVVNSENWGKVSEQELAQYQKLGPLKASQNSDALLFQNRILAPNLSVSKRCALLIEWGKHALQAQQDESALETFEDVLTLDRDNIEALLGIAKTHFQRKTVGRAGLLALEVLRIDSTNSEAQELLESSVRYAEGQSVA